MTLDILADARESHLSFFGGGEAVLYSELSASIFSSNVARSITLCSS